MLKFYRNIVLAGVAMTMAVTAPVYAEDEVVVGAATSLSGWMAAFDTNATKAAEMAVDDINKAGGLLGKKLKYMHIDTKTDPAQTARAAQELISGGSKLLVIACDFDSGAPAALTAQRANVIAISTCGSDIKLGNNTVGNNVFTMATDAAAQGAILADWAYKKQGYRSAYVLLDTFIQYDKSLCAGFTKRWTELAGADSIVLADEFKNADVSVATQISRYQSLSKKADAMMLCSVPPGLASAIRQYRAAGIDIPVMAGTGGDGTAWYSAVPDLSNYYLVSYSVNEGVEEPRPDAREFLAAFKARYGEVPNSGQAITGYAAVQAWAEGVRRAGSFDTDKVRAAMEAFEDVPLASGLTTFKDGLHTNTDRPMLIMSVNGGKGEALGYYDPRSGEYVKY